MPRKKTVIGANKGRWATPGGFSNSKPKHKTAMRYQDVRDAATAYLAGRSIPQPAFMDQSHFGGRRK